jgi:hypothetical protein
MQLYVTRMGCGGVVHREWHGRCKYLLINTLGRRKILQIKIEFGGEK